MLHLALLAALAASPTTGDLVISAESPFALFVDGRQVNVGNLQASWTVTDLGAGRHDIRVDAWPSPFRSEKLAQGFLDIPAGAEVRVKAEPNRLVVYETVNVLGPAPVGFAVDTSDTLAVAVPGASLTVRMPGAPVVVVEERHGRHDRHHDPRPPAGPQPMFDTDFAGLVEAIEAEGFEDGKLNVLRTAAPGTYFSVGQVGQLVDLFAFSAGKIKVVEICKPRILDLQNSFQLYSHFTFEADKKKVRGILGR